MAFMCLRCGAMPTNEGEKLCGWCDKDRHDEIRVKQLLEDAKRIPPEPVTAATGGVKHDQAKPQLELLSSIWLVGVAQVLTFGARKYAAHNWRKGIALSRLLGACLRHVMAFLGGEDRDPETGLSHLYHASCCLMFASELHETRPDLDDRYKSGKRHSTSHGACVDCGQSYSTYAGYINQHCPGKKDQ